MTDDLAKQIAEDPKVLSRLIVRMAEDGVRMRDVLQGIAAQKLPEELEDPEGGDYEYAYCEIVKAARRAVQQLPKGGNDSG